MTGKKKRYSGNRVKNARAIVRRMLPAPCWRCGQIITVDMQWVAGHVRGRHEYGDDDSPSNLLPEHRKCSDRSGGQLRARITNTNKKKQSRQIETRGLQW